MEFDTSFPADREAFELVEQGEGLLDDVAELPSPLMFGEPLREITARAWMRRRRSSPRTAFESYTLSPRRHSGPPSGPAGSSGDAADDSGCRGLRRSPAQYVDLIRDRKGGACRGDCR